jgi:hypothetical protein
MERETKAKGLSPHARNNQLQVGSSGDPIRPLVAEILIFTFISREGKSPILSFVPEDFWSSAETEHSNNYAQKYCKIW